MPRPEQFPERIPERVPERIPERINDPFERFRNDDPIRAPKRDSQSEEQSCDRRDDEGAELLPTISLVLVPHATISNLFQYCYEYVDPWSWSAEAERVETGRWFFSSPEDTEAKPQPCDAPETSS